MKPEQDAGATGTRIQSSSSNCYSTIVLELNVTDSSQNIQISLYRIYYSYLGLESSQQYSFDSISAADYGTEVLTGLSKFGNDDTFGQAGVFVPGIIFFRFKSDWAFRPWQKNRSEGLVLLPSHPTSQELRNCGFTTAKVVVPSESCSTALLIRIWTHR